MRITLGKVFQSCGHEDQHRPVSGWPLMTKDYDTYSDGSFDKVVTYQSVCYKCYLDYLQDFPEYVLFDDYEKEEWLGQKRR